jgi:hypothetical protein
MQDRHPQFDEIFLQRTAGPYIGVKRVGLTMRRSFPVFTYEPTFVDRADWSVSCHMQTHAAQQVTGVS